MIDSILIFILSVLSTTLMFLFYAQRKRNLKILAETLNLIMLQSAQQEDFVSDKTKANEDFLKFISDSREWAYAYIDEVQSSLNKFITDIEPEIKYFDEFGIVGSAYPHYYSMKKISEAYKELKKLLPEDYGKIDT
jgi:type II secretory pathway pseudopilin PulG